MAVAGLDYSAIKIKLNRKTTFEEAIRECIVGLQTSPTETISSQAFRQLLRRAVTVMRTRFSDTDVALFRSGQNLVQAALQACPSTDAAFAEELRSFNRQISAVLVGDGETSGESSLPRQQQHTLFEGQLSAAPTTTAATTPSGAVRINAMHELAALLLGRSLPSPTPPATTTPEEEETTNRNRSTGDGGGTTAASNEAAPPSEELSPEMSAALQRELDAIAIEIMEATANEAPRPPPPASKTAFRSLPRVTVTAGNVEDLGGSEARCPVCMDVQIGEKVVVLPCKHWAHEECLKPWLSGTNTCPTCRHELPTEDQQYERKKEMAKVEAEERRGVENSLSNNEFLYI